MLIRRVKESLADETTRQVVVLAFTVVTVFVVRWAMKPDALKTVKMQGALTTKHFAQRQADWWQTLAGKAATMYNRERP